MSTKWKLICLVSGGLFLSSPVMAIDLVAVHDLALKSDPRLQAAEYRRDATGENRKIARANLLPQINAGGNWSWGESSTKIAGQDLPDQDTETTVYEASLIQSLYRQANYESLDIARGQITQADAIYEIVYQDFLLRVSETYFLTLTLIDGVTFAEAEEKAFQRQFEQAEQRFLDRTSWTHHFRRIYRPAPNLAIQRRNRRMGTGS